MTGTRLKHWTALLFPVLMSLYLLRRSFRIWFLADDFAWLGLSLSVRDGESLLAALFSPMAQGTVRTLSERLFFLVFEQGFGLESLPMRIFSFLTFAVGQVLLVLLVRRLSGSMGAGVLAAVLWGLNFGVSVAMSWLSSYNQILVSTLVLGSVYGFIRWVDGGGGKWLGLSWTCYLLGFGALENMVVLPGILIAYALLFERKALKAALGFVGPAVLFAGAHLFLIPKAKEATNYQMHFDGSLFESCWVYWKWFLGAARLTNFGPDFDGWILPSQIVMTVGVVAFVGWRSSKRDWLPLFGCLVSLAMMAPMLPLRDHRTDYYLASGSIGMAMVLGLMPFRIAPLPWWSGALVLVFYVVPSFIVQQSTFEWYLDRTGPVRPLIRGLQQVTKAHPGKLILVEGVSEGVYDSALEDDALRLIPGQNVRLLPGAGRRGNSLVISETAARTAFEKQTAMVYRFDGVRLRDVTREWETGKALALASGLSPELLAGESSFNGQFLKGWFPPADGGRWMGREAAVLLGRPTGGAKQLEVEAYVPAALGRIRLVIRASGTVVMDEEVKPGMAELRVALPEGLAGESDVRMEISSSRTTRGVGDNRDLSLLFRRIAIQ
jgi:hypothetical protein